MRIESWSPTAVTIVPTGTSVTLSMTFVNVGNIPARLIPGVEIWGMQNGQTITLASLPRGREVFLNPGERSTYSVQYSVRSGSQWVQYAVWAGFPLASPALAARVPESLDAPFVLHGN
ncbi:MAG: hypothetical protein HYV77_04380 [Candidatus Wildermuthbacteria bacterium]|nr:hypothetical protein [Candidatus Wildermuthbacteria bacterium]